MIVYERTHPGVVLTTAERQQLELNNQSAVGFFTKETLSEVIKDFREDATQPTRPGIRIYRVRNSSNTSTLKSLVSVAVKEDGFDAVPFSQRATPWRRSQRIQTNANDATPIAFSTAALTFNAAFGLSRDGNLSAYFSEEMLQPLLEDPNIDGVTFYEVPLDRAPTEKLSPHISGQSGLTSYLAVGTALVDGRITHDSAQMTRNVLSDLPCPGYCLSLATTTAAVANVDIDFNGPPYLIKWTKT